MLSWRGLRVIRSRLNELLDGEKFDRFVEGHCRKFYAPRKGRPGLAPGIYFRSLLIGYFEGLDSEPRDRVASGAFAGAASFCAPRDYGADAGPSTISQTRRLVDGETHRAVFGRVLGLLADRGLLKGKRVGVDATTLV